tara:strand:- start:469 stop:837 length:369 start_codon:yes stop_codon:yes gene_type:complete
MDNNAFSKMYFSLTKDLVGTSLSGVLLEKYKEAIYNDEGVRTGYTTPTWGDVTMMLPHRYSLNWNSGGAHRYKICLIRDTWSSKTGEMTDMIALGTDKSYPYCSMLTNTEAKVLMATDKFVE